MLDPGEVKVTVSFCIYYVAFIGKVQSFSLVNGYTASSGFRIIFIGWLTDAGLCIIKMLQFS